MKVTVDDAGRLVIPKALREAAGITPGAPLEIRFRDGRLEIEPEPVAVELVEKEGLLVAVPRDSTTPLTADDVRATLDRVRTGRG